MTTRSQLDAFIAAFDALGVTSADIKYIDMVNRIDHIITISVPTDDDLARLAAALDLSTPEHHIEGGYAWAEAYRRPEHGTSITVQVHRLNRNSAA